MLIIIIKQPIRIVLEKFSLDVNWLLKTARNSAPNKNIEDKNSADGSRKIPIKNKFSPIDKWLLYKFFIT